MASNARRLAALTAVGALAATVVGPSDPAAAGANARERALLARSLRFRTDAGLRDDPAYVRRVLDGHATDASATRSWGVPLTRAESGELARRERVAAQLVAIERWARTHARGSFAGAWIDQRAGGVVRVGFTRHAAAKLAALRATLPDPAVVRAVRAYHTESELQALAARVDLDPRRGVTEVAADPVHGAVTVGVTHPTDALARELHRRLPGVPLRLVAAPPLRARATENYLAYPTPPVLGALEIFHALDANRVVSCSAGFVSQGSINPRNYWLLTAGHCSEPGATWYHRSGDRLYRIGSTGGDTLADGSDADAETIHLARSARRGAIYINDGDLRPMRWQQRYDADFVGEPVCRSGAGSYMATGEGNACGFVQYTDARVLVTETGGATRTLVHQRVASLFGCEGDSGGPIFKSRTALGVVSAGNGSVCGDRTVYSQIGHVTRRLHVHLDGAAVTSTVR